MTDADIFFVKLKKVINHFEGANELEMGRQFAIKELVKLNNDILNSKLVSTPPIFFKSVS